jgi:hypothetical protein
MKTEQRKPYTAPTYRMLDLLLSSVVCGTNTPGDDLPWDPSEDDLI